MPREVDPKYQVSWQEELKSNFRGIWLIARSAPGFFLVNMGTTFAQGVLPAVIVAQTGLFMKTLSSDPQVARRALVVIAGAIFLSQMLGPIREAAMFGLQRKFHAYITRRVMVAVDALPGIAYFEDPKFRDKLKVSEWVGWAPTNSINAASQAFQQASTLSAFALIAASFSWWVPALVIGSALPAGFAAVYFEAGIGLARWRHSNEIRQSDYYRNLSLLLEPAKELRIFRVKDWVIERQVSHWLAGVREAWAKRRTSLLIRIGLQVPAVAAMSYTFIRVLQFAVSQRELGNLEAAGVFGEQAMAIVGMTTAVIALFQAASWARQSNFYLPVAFQLMELAHKDPRLDVAGARPAQGVAHTGIEFQKVTFVYPGTERKVLDSLDLSIPAGSSLALVGENGAGKTTLIKLLCRFYDPTEGRILLDGIDIREFDLESLRNRLAVIFQDFVHYHLSARDNVGFGAVERMTDDSLLVASAERIGVLEKIQSLPSGWDTPLAREFDGVDLSGGEWQRIALARAIMAQIGRDADVLILDEPTASLDVRLEHQLYRNFSELASGRTTLLVSHRFSTVRMAERIVFMEEGKVVEDGSHSSLIAGRGRYAELYEMQASHYRLSGSLE
jgi:ATP-binding cassette subfamily B protein